MAASTRFSGHVNALQKRKGSKSCSVPMELAGSAVADTCADGSGRNVRLATGHADRHRAREAAPPIDRPVRFLRTRPIPQRPEFAGDFRAYGGAVEHRRQAQDTRSCGVDEHHRSAVGAKAHRRAHDAIDS